MTAPTLVSTTNTAFTKSSSSTAVTASISVQSGDILVARGGTEDTAFTLTISGGGLTWSLQQSNVLASRSNTYVWTTTATSTTSLTVTVTCGGFSGSVSYGVSVEVWRNSGGVGNSAKNNATSGSSNVSLTTAGANSGVSAFAADWNAVNGSSRTWRTVNGSAMTENLYVFVSGVATYYGADTLDAGTAGANTYGTSAPTGEQFTIVAVEIKGTAGGSATVTPPAGSLSLTGLTPTVTATANQTVAVPAGSLSLTGLVPSIATTANQTVSAPLGTLSLTGLTPTVSATANQTIAVPVGSLSLTGLVPSVQTGGSQLVSAPLGTLSLSGLIPTVTAIANQTVPVPAGSLSLTGLVPTVNVSTTIAVPLGQLVLNGLVPTIGLTQNILIDAPLAQLSLNAPVPTIVGQIVNVPVTEVPAGRSRRVRSIYRVTIDGQVFEFDSLSKALRLLEQAKEMAQQVARAKIQNTPKASLKAPVITASHPELRAPVIETRQQIAKTYERANIDMEIALLMELDDRRDDDALTLLM